jgi:hypothetical protein
MNKKQISIMFMGIILFYAGVLSLADELYAGVGMMIGGSVLVVMPLWKAFFRSRNLSGGATGSVKTGKRKKKGHLKVVKREDEERPTYH